MDLIEYRNSPQEKERISDLISLIPNGGELALDIGARDGYLSIILTEHFKSVIALDLEKPIIDHRAIQCIKGDVCSLEFEDNSFDLVLCAEVLEHIPKALLSRACSEIARVCKNAIIIGVPYKQDIRIGRTTCLSCNAINPPWGHINSFDEDTLNKLFPTLVCDQQSFVGESHSATNSLSTMLTDFAGNPYGTYSQEESCIYCGNKLQNPLQRNLVKKVATRLALLLNRFQQNITAPHPNWIHARFLKTRNSYTL